VQEKMPRSRGVALLEKELIAAQRTSKAESSRVQELKRTGGRLEMELMGVRRRSPVQDSF